MYPCVGAAARPHIDPRCRYEQTSKSSADNRKIQRLLTFSSQVPLPGKLSAKSNTQRSDQILSFALQHPLTGTSQQMHIATNKNAPGMPHTSVQTSIHWHSLCCCCPLHPTSTWLELAPQKPPCLIIIIIIIIIISSSSQATIYSRTASPAAGRVPPTVLCPAARIRPQVPNAGVRPHLRPPPAATAHSTQPGAACS